MTKLPKLLDDVAADNEERPTVLDATQQSQIDDYTKRAPKIIAMLPDILHRSRTTDVRHVAALEEMSKDLLRLVERARPLLLVRFLFCSFMQNILILVDLVTYSNFDFEHF